MCLMKSVKINTCKGKPFCNLWNLFEEIGALNFLDSRRPRYVVREQVGENSLADWNR